MAKKHWTEEYLDMVDENRKRKLQEQLIIAGGNLASLVGTAYYIYANPPTASVFANVAIGAVGTGIVAGVVDTALIGGKRLIENLMDRYDENIEAKKIEKYNEDMTKDSSKGSIVMDRNQLYHLFNEFREDKIEFTRESFSMKDIHTKDSDEREKMYENHKNGMWQLVLDSYGYKEGEEPFYTFEKDGKVHAFFDKNKKFSVTMNIGLGNDDKDRVSEWQNLIGFEVKPDDKESMDRLNRAIDLFQKGDREGYFAFMKELGRENKNLEWNQMRDTEKYIAVDLNKSNDNTQEVAMEKFSFKNPNKKSLANVNASEKDKEKGLEK